MNTFLTSLVAVALYMIGKFVYDTFITNSTKRDWDNYKASNPEDAARIERNKGLNLSTMAKSNERDKRESLLRMARNINCSPSLVREKFIADLMDQKLDAEGLKQLIQMIRQEKYKESKKFDIDPEDTASAFMESWITETLQNRAFVDRKRTDKDVVRDFLATDERLNKIAKSGKKNEVEEYLANNPDLLDSMISDFGFASQPAKRYRNLAIDKMFDDKDFTGAIQLIDQGLQLDEPETEPFLYSLRSDCQMELFNSREALADMNRAIESLKRHSPEEYYSLSDFLARRSKIKQQLGDREGVLEDNRISADYLAKHNAIKKNLEHEDDLPF